MLQQGLTFKHFVILNKLDHKKSVYDSTVDVECPE